MKSSLSRAAAFISISTRARLATAARAALVPGMALLGACADATRPAVDRIRLSAPHETVFQGDTVRVAATPLSATTGESLPAAPITWTSSDTTVATVQSGLVSALRPGTVTIFATRGDAQGALGLRVAAEVWAVYARPGGIEALPGKVVHLSVVNRFNRVVEVPVTYSSSDTTVASVSKDGEVTAEAPGTALVTIHYLTRRLEVPVRVRAVGYRVTHLGDLGGGASQALGLNERGQVVGRSVTAGGTWQGFLWEEGTMRAISYPGLAFTEAVAVNERGVVVGNAGNFGCLACPVSVVGLRAPWQWEDGKLTPIEIQDTITGADAVYVTDLNDAGQVSGNTFAQGIRGSTWGAPFIWEDGETRFVWRPYATHYRAQVDGINNEGIVVGRVMSNTLGTWGAGWRAEVTVRAAPSEAPSSYATDINDRGQVVGYISPSTEDLIGIYRVSEDGASFLGAPDALGSPPEAINNRGEIVGGSDAPGSIPFLWRNGYFVDLNNLLDDPEWTITAATDINDRGQIVGYGRRRDSGATGALLLTPQ